MESAAQKDYRAAQQRILAVLRIQPRPGVSEPVLVERQEGEEPGDDEPVQHVGHDGARAVPDERPQDEPYE